MSNFSSWTLIKLNKRFGLQRVSKLTAMEEWLNASMPLTEFDTYFLQQMQENLTENIFAWNEEELAQHFIGPVITWTKFTTPYCNIFNKRAISAIVDGEELAGEPDGIIASGKDEPEKPFFCFHEYKKEIDYSRDPAGQCLAAMLAAQVINEHKYPIYGIYVVGQNWNFMALKGKEYLISESLSAMGKDIYIIFQRLLWLKKQILRWIKQDLGIANEEE